MIRAGINGYGTTEKRVADAIHAQPSIELVDAAKTQSDFKTHTADEHGYPTYVATPERSSLSSGAGVGPTDKMDELVVGADIIVGCTSPGIGTENRGLYRTHHTPAIFQGGEDTNATDVNFNARASLDITRDADHVRVVSCNMTDLSRTIAPLEAEYGVKKVRVTLVYRGGDPGQNPRGLVNDTLPNPTEIPPRHDLDVKTIFPGLEIDTLGLKVPATLMHVHTFNATLKDGVIDAHVRQLLESENRVYVIPEGVGIGGTGRLVDFVLDAGYPHGDVWESCVQGESIGVNDRDLHLFQAVHQQSDVIPGDVDTTRAMFDTEDQQDNMALIGRTFDIDISGDPSRFSKQARVKFADD